MDIVHITTECAPFAKVGGLGDMVYGLAKESKKLNQKVRVFLPKYGEMEKKGLKNLQVLQKDFVLTFQKSQTINCIWSAQFEDLSLLLLEISKGPDFFKESTIYSSNDLDNDRFLYFCKAAMEYLQKQKEIPDILHLHDWPTAACTLLQKEKEKTTPKIVFTIHNISYQGICSPFNLERIGLDPEKYLFTEKLEDAFYSSNINLLKGAIKYSDAITAVSPTYAKEIQTEEFGCGLEKILQKEENKLSGILNGIDREYWNPSKDPYLFSQYDEKTAKKEKPKNKEKVYKKLHLHVDSKPLVIAITRLVPQKGVDLLLFGVTHTLKLGGKFILLGSVSDPEIIQQCQELQNQYKNHPDVSFCLEYDEELSHLLYAGGDMLLMPSIFEPCGLTQMIALRYGTVPLVRATGGLKDTVFDLDDSENPNGFTFVVPDNTGIANVLDRAFATYREKSDVWEGLMQKGMLSDYSWKISGGKYLELYQKIIK